LENELGRENLSRPNSFQRRGRLYFVLPAVGAGGVVGSITAAAGSA
jgi:hypothetical protein